MFFVVMFSFVAGVGVFLLEEFWVNSENSFSVRVPWMFVCFCLGFLGAKYKELPNMAMENNPFENVFPIENGDFPLLC